MDWTKFCVLYAAGGLKAVLAFVSSEQEQSATIEVLHGMSNKEVAQLFHCNEAEAEERIKTFFDKNQI